jgi:hypothetical protein
MISRASNECRLDGRLIVIKTAASTTDSVRVTYRMLERLDGAFGCWENAEPARDLGTFPGEVSGSRARELEYRRSRQDWNGAPHRLR